MALEPQRVRLPGWVRARRRQSRAAHGRHSHRRHVTFNVPPAVHQLTIYEPGTQPEDIDTTALTTLAAFAVSENRGAAKGRPRGASVREGALCR